MRGSLSLLACAACFLSAATRAASESRRSIEDNAPNITSSGYLAVNKDDGSKLFYSYYEAQEGSIAEAPILLWLQGGPGCASHFGNFYELGPQRVNESLFLNSNPGSWNRKAGLLFIDQPVGTGFSISGKGRIPSEESEIATDFYVALQDFFERHKSLQQRSFVISGESYAGKYVPTIGMYILQMERLHGRRPEQPGFSFRSMLPPEALSLGPPKFKLSGLVIGNGLTDPLSQVQTHADTAFFQGLINTQQRVSALAMQLRVSQAIVSGDWGAASRERESLLKFLQGAIGTGTMLDSRRTYDYDHKQLVDQYLNFPEVKEHLRVSKEVNFTSCSEEVAKILGADVMKSVKHVIPQLLDNYPLLLYQGAFDLQDGPASSEAWIHSLNWIGRRQFAAAQRCIWRAEPNGRIPPFKSAAPASLEFTAQAEDGGKKLGRVVGYWREWGPLTHVIIRESGHMVPHDDGMAAQAMVESWLKSAVLQERDAVEQ